MRISVIGTGYLGATHSACMAELGHEVVGVDVDPTKIAALAEGQVPFHEPGLADMIRRHVASGRLRFTTDYDEVGPWADVHFIGVGTPQSGDGGAADLTFVDAAIDALADHITRDSLIAGKSTVPVGTATRLATRLAERRAARGLPGAVTLAWNPEFLREGFAVEDTLHPDRLVVGSEDPGAVEVLRAVYAAAVADGTPWIDTDFETAELVKVAANAFLATKISFINAFAEIMETTGGDIRTLADAIGLDDRIGRKFLNAGVGFGGGCLPKDIRALRARAGELGHGKAMAFLEDIDDINRRRRQRVVDLVTSTCSDIEKPRIAVLGAAFKPNSDDIRDSPALDVAERLSTIGQVLMYDPEAGDNVRARTTALQVVDSAALALQGADVAVLLTEWQEFKDLDPRDTVSLMRHAVVIDGRGVLDPAAWSSAGATFLALGRRPEA